MKLDDVTKLLGTTSAFLATISPHLAAAVQAGVVVADIYNDFEASRAEIARLLAQDTVTKAEIDALDDSIQARSKRIKDLLNPPSA